MKSFALLLLMLSGVAAFADDLPAEGEATTPMPGGFEAAWKKFYFEADGEGSIIPNLMDGGKVMVPSICKAVTDRKMRMRRYAIGALGYHRDRRAILTLEKIYADSTEDNIFRGDALHAIFCIDQKLGLQYARSVLRRNYTEDNYLLRVAQGIIESPKDWNELPEPS